MPYAERYKEPFLTACADLQTRSRLTVKKAEAQLEVEA
jgi:hypothetical protein